VYLAFRGLKKIATKRHKKHRRGYFASNHFAKKLVMISADKWLKISHKREQKTQRF
jgi:hypothetical protein